MGGTKCYDTKTGISCCYDTSEFVIIALDYILCFEIEKASLRAFHILCRVGGEGGKEI